jgi:hypothetical protein
VVFAIVPVVWYYLSPGSWTAPNAFPFKKSAWFEQLATAGAIGIVKPLYTILSLALILILRRPASKAGAALLWGLIFFFFAELACGVNIVFYRSLSYSLEFMHSYGMVLNFAFVTYALIQTADARVLNYSDPLKRCALSAVCVLCFKSRGGPCLLRRLAFFFLAVLAILAFIPLMSNFNVVSFQTQILKWNYIFSRPEVFQAFDFRLVPLYALLFLISACVALLLIRKKGMEIFKVLLAAGVGSLSFSYLRLIFFDAFAGNLIWAEFWEEFTELTYIGGVVFLIWLAGDQRLQSPSASEKKPTGSAPP